MIINPKVRGFKCGSAHPEGCRVHVQEQINYIKERKKLVGPKNVLIIGATTGYGRGQSGRRCEITVTATNNAG